MYRKILQLSNLFVKLAQTVGVNPSSIPFNEPIVSSFDMNELKNLTRVEDIYNYVNMTLSVIGVGTDNQGIGSSRYVYDIGDDKVLKVAMNRAGIAQNHNEARIWTSSPLFAKVYDIHPKSIWIVAEKIKPFNTPMEFIMATRLPVQIYQVPENKFILNNPTPERLAKLEQKYNLLPSSLDLLTEMARIRGQFNLLGGDTFNRKHWGTNKDYEIKLLDFGLDTTMRDTFYEKQEGGLFVKDPDLLKD